MNDHFVGLQLKYQRNQQMDALSSLYIWYEHFLTMQVYFILQHKRNDRDVDLTQESITYLSNVTIFIFHAKNFPFLPPSFWLNLSPIFLFPWNFHASPDPLAPSSSSLFSYDRWTQFRLYIFDISILPGHEAWGNKTKEIHGSLEQSYFDILKMAYWIRIHPFFPPSFQSQRDLDAQDPIRSRFCIFISTTSILHSSYKNAKVR